MLEPHVYSLVRCVPDPRTGEFINIAAIVGSAATGQWAVRQVSSERRAVKLADAQILGVVHAFLAQVGMDIDARDEEMELGVGDALDESWLDRMHHDHRNVVQLTSPTPMLAESPEAALELLFEHMIIDPVSQQRDFITKHRVVSDLKEAYRRASIKPQLVHNRVEVYVGDRVHTNIDYAIANGSTLQLTQAWSFQRAGVEEISTQVKAWGYALGRLRSGERARLLGPANLTSDVASDVDLQVVVAKPRTKDQQDVYGEAQQVFDELGVVVHDLNDVDAIGRRAAELIDDR